MEQSALIRVAPPMRETSQSFVRDERSKQFAASKTMEGRSGEGYSIWTKIQLDFVQVIVVTEA